MFNSGIRTQEIYWILLIQNESTAQLIINNKLSEPFNIERGVKQGDPLSPLLFTFAVEVLARCKVDDRFRDGFPIINNIEISHLMYADDTCLMATDTDRIQLWLQYLTKLQKATGLTINMKKTFTINSSIPELQEMKDKFAYLGFTFQPEGMVDDFEELIMKTITNLKNQRNNKRNIHYILTHLKCYILSTIYYKGFLVGKESKMLEDEITKFLWYGKVDNKKYIKVSRVRREQPMCHGGLGIIPTRIRFQALRARMMDCILHNKEMKLYYLIDRNKMSVRDLAYKEITHTISESKFIQGMFKDWRNSIPKVEDSWKIENNQQVDFFAETHEVKEYQKIISRNENITYIFTKKQTRFKSMFKLNLGMIFINVNRVKEVNLRSFMWNYFQGALFGKRGSCVCKVDDITYSHFFFHCTANKSYREQADKLFKMLYYEIETRSKHSPCWTEPALWNLWNSKDEEDDLYRDISMCFMRAMYWNNHLQRRDDPIDAVNRLINAQIVRATNIRNHKEREEELEIIEKEWNLVGTTKQAYKYYRIRDYIVKQVRGTPSRQ